MTILYVSTFFAFICAVVNPLGGVRLNIFKDVLGLFFDPTSSSGNRQSLEYDSIDYADYCPRNNSTASLADCTGLELFGVTTIPFIR